MMRKRNRRLAGDNIGAEFQDLIREGVLAANRSQPIGAGTYGVVYQSDTPGNVMKQSTYWGQDFKEEADMQAIAGEMGIAPQVRGLEQFYNNIGDRIEMADARTNYRPVDASHVNLVDDPTVQIRTAQQLGQLALKGIRLEDRHAGNVMQHRMTGRPLQLDFGSAAKMSSDQQAAHLANVTAEGFEAAGIGEMGDILRATVMDYLEGGQVKEALDVAKQGFSRLQKIKGPLTEEAKGSAGDRAYREMLAMLEAQIQG